MTLATGASHEGRKKERRGEFSSHSLSAPGCSSSRMIEVASCTRSSSSFSVECREYRFPPLGSFTRHPLLHSPLFFIPGVSATASREKPRTRSVIVFLFEKKRNLLKEIIQSSFFFFGFSRIFNRKIDSRNFD